MRRRWIIVLGSLLIAALGIFLSQTEWGQQLALLQRFAALASDPNGDDSTSGRIGAYASALQLFVDSPLFGSDLVEHHLGYYPHNLILEVLMSTGLLGLVPMAVMLTMSLGRTFHALIHAGRYRWVHILNLQYFIALMFSGAIVTSAQFWFLICFCALALPRDGVRVTAP